MWYRKKDQNTDKILNCSPASEQNSPKQQEYVYLLLLKCCNYELYLSSKILYTGTPEGTFLTSSEFISCSHLIKS